MMSELIRLRTRKRWTP